MGAKVRIPGSTALITGAGSGIGRATALAMAQRGAKVLAVDLNEASAKATAESCQEIGVESVAFQCDVANRAAVVALAEQVHREHGTLQILVNNAGVGMSGRFLDMSLDDWEWIRSINLDGVLHGCHAFVPAMLEQGRGHVVNLSSGLAFLPQAMTPAYSTTKAAVLMFSRSVRADWATRGVGVTAICPGFIDTPIIERTRFFGDVDNPRAVALTKRGFSMGHPPELAASTIIKAIERNRAMAGVGWEARAGFQLTRILPSPVVTLAARPLPDFVGRFLNRSGQKAIEG